MKEGVKKNLSRALQTIIKQETVETLKSWLIPFNGNSRSSALNVYFKFRIGNRRTKINRLPEGLFKLS